MALNDTQINKRNWVYVKSYMILSKTNTIVNRKWVRIRREIIEAYFKVLR